MILNDTPQPRTEAEHEDCTSLRFFTVVANLLAVAALMDVGLAFWHRHKIAEMWNNLRRRSYPPFEAYETIGIDMDTAFGFWPISCAWIVLQISSALLFLCVCRRTRLAS